MSGRVYLLGVGVALVALALAFTDRALSLQPGVTEANAKRIRLGMTLQEVEALLGSPNSLIAPVPFKVGTTIPRPPDGEWENGRRTWAAGTRRQGRGHW